GITTTVRATPNKPGSYPAECTELCGAGHGLMRANVQVVTPAAFQTWLASQKSAPVVGTPPANVSRSGAYSPGSNGSGNGLPAGGSPKSGTSSPGSGYS